VARRGGRTAAEVDRPVLRGLKTTYYLRSMGATHAEKSTTKTGALNAVTSEGAAFHASADTSAPLDGAEPKFCAIDNPDCEACQ
jgi:ribonucleoside-diphosphate reductase alpha chain